MTEEVKQETAPEELEQQATEPERQTDDPTPEEREQALNDKYLRLMAEFDNFKKRTQKEKTQIYTSAAAEVVEAMLPFVDNLERATAIAVESEEAKQVLEGVCMMKRQFEETLTNLGVTAIQAVGEEFNPELHNAVMHVDDDTVAGESIIVEEFAKGYLYKDKVIRHSTVKVAN